MPENYLEYLRRVAADFRESGSTATAEDYEEAATRIEEARDKLIASAELRSLKPMRQGIVGAVERLIRR